MPEVNENLKNVYFDTAASPFLYDQRIFNVVSSLTSPERILLASDYPLIPHRRVSNQLDNSSLNETQKSDIRGGNAKILLNL
jgi:predicted TIM-barrel fold metal-dependent hydrolase